jgi:ABC-type Fe3+ transport system permease subunit
MSRGLELLTAVLVGCLVLVLLVIAANISNRAGQTASRSRTRGADGARRRRRGWSGRCSWSVLFIGTIAAAIGLTASQAVLAW